jgi:hypothetical protein
MHNMIFVSLEDWDNICPAISSSAILWRNASGQPHPVRGPRRKRRALPAAWGFSHTSRQR